MAAASACPGEVEALARARLLAWSVYFGTANPDIGSVPDHVVDELVDEALHLYREAGALEELAEMSSILAVMYSTRGNQPRMRQLVLDAEQLLGALDSTPRVVAMRVWVSARRALYEGRHAEAESGFIASTELLRACGDEALCAFNAMYLGRVALFRGDDRTSVSVLERGLALARELGLLGLADLLTTDLGDALAVVGDVDRARALLAEARTAGRDLIFLPGHGRPLIALALLERREGNIEAAFDAATEAFELVVAGNNRDGIANCLAVLGFLAEERGDIDTALKYHLRGLGYASETGEPRSTALALEGLAGIAQHERDGRRAGRLLGAADMLRQSSTWRTGWSVASAERGDVERITRAAIAVVGTDAFADAFASGAADPGALLHELRAGAR
jgi:tetratricopeptide (TPR) repeat protein